MPRKTAMLQIRIDPELKAAAERAAADDQRTLTSQVAKLLMDYCREQGHLPKRERDR